MAGAAAAIDGTARGTAVAGAAEAKVAADAKVAIGAAVDQGVAAAAGAFDGASVRLNLEKMPVLTGVAVRLVCCGTAAAPIREMGLLAAGNAVAGKSPEGLVKLVLQRASLRRSRRY